MPSRTSSDTTDDVLQGLAARAFRAFHELEGSSARAVVRPGVPILWFGDIEAYRRSPLRVLTVGLNPSLAEFPANDPFQRLRAAASLSGVDDIKAFAQYKRALSSYFLPSEDPYRSWFASFEPLLRGMAASYYPGQASTAIHTDICSPIATSPTWGKLDARVRQDLIVAGRPLWHDLVRELMPQVILISVGKSHLNHVAFEASAEWKTIYTVERTNPYQVIAKGLRIKRDGPALLVFGRAAQKPFGLITDVEKAKAGAAILGALDD